MSSVPEKSHDFFSFSVQLPRNSRRPKTGVLADVPPSDADTGSEMENNSSPGPSSGKRRCRHRGHIHQRSRGPQRPAQEYRQTNEYWYKTPRATDTTRSRERRGAVVTCLVCHHRYWGQTQTVTCLLLTVIPVSSHAIYWTLKEFEGSNNKIF